MAEITPVGDLHGFLVPDRRITQARLRPKGAGALDSSYTQSDPRTGPAEAQQDTAMVLGTSGGQSEDGALVIRSLRAGHPGLEEGGYGWRNNADAATLVRGWEPYQLATKWETLYYSTLAVGYDLWPDAVRLQSGRLLVAYSVSSLGVVQISRYDPATAAWTAVNLTPSGSGAVYITRGCSLLQLPSGRVLAFVIAPDRDQVDTYYSDDDGTTWTAAAYRILETAVATTDTRTIRARYSAGEILIVLTYLDGADFRRSQYASDDLGATATWISQVPVPGTQTRWVGAVGLPDGGFVVAQRGSGTPAAIRIGSAYEVLANASSVSLGGAGTLTTGVAIVDDDDGLLYYILLDTTDSATILYRSSDGGASWTLYSSPLHVTQGSDRLDSFAGEIIEGRMALVARWTASVATHDPQSVAVLWLGGWSTMTAPAGSNQGLYTDTMWISWADDRRTGVASALDGGLYLPIEEPGDNAWTTAGAGTDVLTASLLAVDTVANTRTYTRDLTIGNISMLLAVFVEVALQIDAGSGDDTTDRIAARIRLTDRSGGAGLSTYDYEVGIRMDDAGFRLRDYYAGGGAGADIGAPVVIAMTTRLRIRLMIDASGNVRSWYARDGHARTWTAGPTGTATNNGATANDRRVQWGHLAAGTDGSDWELVGYCFWAGRFAPQRTGAAAAQWVNPDDLHARSWPTRESGVIDDIRIEALDGPSYLGQQWDIAADYDYPVSVIHPEVEPSPSAVWRSTADEVEVRLVYDLTSLASGGRLLNHSIGAFFLRTNIGSFFVEYYDGAAWQQIGEARAYEGYDSLSFLRDGDVVFPDTAVNHAAAAYLHYGAMVDGTFRLDANTYRRIVEHSEGAWRDDATKRPWVRLRDVTDAEPASGTGRIYSRDFGILAHNWATDARYLRIRIPSQITAEGYYEIGQLVLGHCVVLGRPYSRGRTTQRTYRTDLSEWRSGQVRSTRLGPRRREVTFGWSDGLDATPVQVSSPQPDYVAGTAGGSPVAAMGDSILLMGGLHDDRQGPVRPLLYLPRIPRGQGANTVRLADPEGMVWGHFRSDPVRENVLGEEGVDELDRLATLRFVELV